MPLNSHRLAVPLAACACVALCACELIGGIEDRSLETGGTGGSAPIGGSAPTGGSGPTCRGVATLCVPSDSQGGGSQGGGPPGEIVRYDAATGCCYRLLAGQQTWEQAETECATHGGWLAAITDLQEFVFVKGMLDEAEAAWEPSTLYKVRIGLRKSSTEWTWSTGEPYGPFTRWHGGDTPEPNFGSTPACAFAFSSNEWEWHDEGCDPVLQSLCEE